MRLRDSGPVAWKATAVSARYVGVDISVSPVRYNSMKMFAWAASGHGAAISGAARSLRVAMKRAEATALRLWKAKVRR